MIMTHAAAVVTTPKKLPRVDRLIVLEAVRGFAASYVVLGHFANVMLHNPRWSFPLRFSQEAVILFFLLSGFVIYYSSVCGGRVLTARDYFVKRVRRIYPLFLVSLAFSYGMESLAARSWLELRPGLLLGNVAMLQDFASGKPGVWVATYYNPVLWSLSYEWWFYCMFFAIWKLVPSRGAQKYVAAAISLCGTVTYYYWVPNQASLFMMYLMIWWSGAELAAEYAAERRVSWRGQRATILMLAALAVLWVVPVVRAIARHEPLTFGLHPVMEARHIVAAVVFLVGGLVWRRLGMRGFGPTLGWFAVVAPVSYGIYALHFPIIDAVDSFAPGRWEWPKLALIVLLSVGFAYALEVKLQRVINGWTDRRLLGKSRAVRPIAAGLAAREPSGEVVERVDGAVP